MKKLFAILLSVLMLCAMIPFATIAAAEEPAVQVSIDAKEVEPGDEFEVTVNLLNIPDPGLIGAQVEVVFDPEVFELVTYYDEDEEADFNMIEVGSKYNASSNKYITFGKLGACLVQYLRATASASQTRKEEHFFTATFKVKDDAKSGTYDLTPVYNKGSIVSYGTVGIGDQFTAEAASIKVNGNEPACDHVYTTSHDASCNVCGAIRDVVLSAGAIIFEGGLSTSKDKTGLAFKFDVTANGIVFDKEYNANYSNATVTIDGVEYKLVKMGAIVNNLGLSDLELADVNGGKVKNVEALKVFDNAAGSTSYAVRVINIPEAYQNAEITVRPYCIYDANGEQITLYGEDVVSTYKAALNG